MSQSQYTQEQKDEALRIYESESLRAAVKATGIPKGTISYWVWKHGAKTHDPERTRAAVAAKAAIVALRREELKNDFLDTIDDLLSRMNEPHKDFRGKDADEVLFDKATSTDVRNYAVSVGILLDKLRLESGESTSNDGPMSTEQAKALLAELLGVEPDQAVDEMAKRRKERKSA